MKAGREGVPVPAIPQTPVTADGYGRLLHMTVFRTLLNHPLSWIIMPLIVFYGERMVMASRGGPSHGHTPVGGILRA